MVRAAMWHRVELFALEKEQQLEELDVADGWDQDRWADALDDFFDTYDHVVIEDRARSPRLLRIEEESRQWRVTQTVMDPDENNDFVLQAIVDLEETDDAGELVLHMEYAGDLAKAPWR